ncbi:hypothetical protein [Candidatus Tokpelaia sp.]|uniref:hypothetical protein n=1 Tax=Candidatus Tokpelaia sp. TaxID=2233777 RepID=UPI00123A6164|nr:hypothetical protein [Candidatus Tokpelaia sp.]KAA6405949.1 hypothetical protein DPQ22_02000 [Candidatus Tokpelaia sp.]
MQRVLAFFLIFLSVFMNLPAAQAVDYRAAFLQSVRGQWSGKGEVVAGRYKGIKFSCKLSTPTAENEMEMNLDGTCRTGIFSQPVKARISRRGSTFHGSFNEGAQANGLDIIAGAIHKNHMTLELNRDKLNGNIIARLEGDNLLHITLAVKIDEEIIPVIGMDLNRIAPEATRIAAKSDSAFAWLRK